MDVDEPTQFKALQDDLSPAHLSLSFLGPPKVIVDGQAVIVQKNAKPLALLAYLAVEAGRPHQRRALTTLFWPDQPDRQALQNLRQVLMRLRQIIDDQAADPPHLLIDQQTIQFNPHSDYWFDVTAFTKLVSRVQEHRHRRLEACPTCLYRLAQAVEYYRGGFLTGMYSVGSNSFDDWLIIHWEQLTRQACDALQALAGAHLVHGKQETTCRYARRLLHLDPWNEAGQRLQLQAILMRDGRNAALQKYEIFREALAGELGVEPEDETLALVENIRGGQLLERRSRSTVPPLPRSSTPFVGRAIESRQLSGDLALRDRRLLTLFGPGGSGKTRLALEVASEQTPLWRDGVWFISLDGVPDPEQLLDALAAGLHFQMAGDHLEAAQLIDFLRPKELLLILDGFEHLLGGALLLQEILRSAPEVKILLTSRARLGLQEERVIPLEGLDVPAELPPNVKAAERYSAIRLFSQSARRSAHHFALTAENLPHVMRICRLVAGLPLGVELAAAWVRLFRCQEIAQAVEESLDFLKHSQADVPSRQHSLRATFAYSYDLLSEREQLLFCKLSVFRDGFRVEASRQIAGTGPSDLTSLVDKSLLQISPSRRLGVHAALREYAAEKLAGFPQKEQRTRGRHSRFYLTFIQTREEALLGDHPKKGMDELWAEIGNVRKAWRWAVAQAMFSEIEAGMPGLARFYLMASLLREGEAAFRRAADHLLTLEQEDSETLRVAGRLRLEQATLLLRWGRYPQLIQVAQAAIKLAQAARDGLSEARGAYFWGAALWNQGSFEAAQTQLDRALSLAREGGDETIEGDARTSIWLEGKCLNLLAAVCWSQGRMEEAEDYLEQMLSLCSRSGDGLGEAAALGNLGILAEEQGEYAEAKARYKRALRIHQETGHRQGESTGFVNLGELHLILGAYAQAESYLQQALAINREIGMKQNEALVLGYLGLLAHYQGDDEIAREYSQQALEIVQEVGDRARQGMMWMILGHSLLGLGQLEAATQAFQESVAIRRELNQPNLVMESLAGLASVELVQGDPVAVPGSTQSYSSGQDLEQALAHVEEILDHLETGTLDGATSLFQVYLTCYHVLQAGHDPRAGEVLGTAYDLLQERAARIVDEELRRSFLENVAAHREIVRVWGGTG